MKPLKDSANQYAVYEKSSKTGKLREYKAKVH